MGNCWCDVIKVIPKKGREEWLQYFFDAIEASHDECEE